MPFGLSLNTERAKALQQTIQDELIARGYSTEPDPVMAEYITIMIINNKTSAQIISELEDLIGPDFDVSFMDWLFVEAAKGSEAETPAHTAEPSTEQPATTTTLPREAPPHLSTSTASKSNNGPRSGVYHQAISQALPQGSSSQKRTASARSPSPNHPNKIRRTDLPTAPRAMQSEGQGRSNPRSLIDRVGPGPSQHKNGGHDDIQARIDTITNNPNPNMMMPNGFPGMNGMDMNAMAMGNPLMLQEIMMNQMALMAQITGMMNTGQQFNGGFPMMPQDMAAMMQQQGMGMNGFQGGHQGGQPGRGRGSGRGGRGGRGGKGGSSIPHEGLANDGQSQTTTPTPAPAPATAAPATVAAPTPTSAAQQQQLPYAIPERPQSPTLCKFGLKCTNANCRWSHPSPVATVESGVVLSNDPCENGKDCKDKDCIKAHVSPAVLKPQAELTSPPPPPPPPAVHPPAPNTVPCRFGAACTRPNCTFSHPPRPSNSVNHFNTPCRFGAGCTRQQCPFQHPEGRVLPNTFHRGLSTTSPLVKVQAPETGTMGGAASSKHRSVTFNNPSNAGLKEKLKEIEEKKLEAEKAVKEAEAAAAAAVKTEPKPEPIAT